MIPRRVSRGSRWRPRPATVATAAILEGFAQDAKAARGGARRRRRCGRLVPPRAQPGAGAVARVGEGQAELEPRWPRRPCGPSPGTPDARARLTEILTGARLPARPAPRGPAGPGPAPRRRHSGHRAGPRRQARRRPQDRGDHLAVHFARSPGPRGGGQGLAAAQDGRRPAAAVDRRADPPRRRCRPRPRGLLPGRHQCLRELPPRAGPGPVDRAGPLDDRRQVRPRRADPIDPEPQRRDRLQLPIARAGPGRRPRDHGPARRGDRRPDRPQDGRRRADHGGGRARSRSAGPATSRSCPKGWPRP